MLLKDICPSFSCPSCKKLLNFFYLHTVVAKFCRENLRIFSADFFDLKSKIRRHIYFLDVWKGGKGRRRERREMLQARIGWGRIWLWSGGIGEGVVRGRRGLVGEGGRRVEARAEKNGKVEFLTWWLREQSRISSGHPSSYPHPCLWRASGMAGLTVSMFIIK